MSAPENDLIETSYERLAGALAPPADAVERVTRRMSGRRRNRRLRRTGLAAVVVVGVVGGVTLVRSGDDPRGTVAVDQPPGPRSTLALTRPDGTTYAFDDVTVSCEPPTEVEGDAPGRIWMTSPMRLTGEPGADDTRALEPFVYFKGVVAKLQGDRTFHLPHESAGGASDDRPMTLFIADPTGANEVSSAEPGATGTVRVVRASCEPTPVLELEVDATLGSELQKQSLDVAGSVG